MKKIRELIVFTAFLVVALWKFDVVIEVLKSIWKIVFPFALGGAIAFVLLGSGEINHSGSGENRQFWSNENHQSGVASPQVVLFTRPAAGQPVSQQKYARQPSPASCPGSSPP